MPMRPEELTLVPDDPSAVIEAMDQLRAAHRGWINLRPEVPEEHDPGEPGVFSGTGPAVPLCTWSPGEQRRRRVEPASIGIQHAAGPKAGRLLADAGHPVPTGWTVVMDHSRRGLVVRLPDDVAHADVVSWLLEAGDRLARAPVTGRWLAAVFRP